MLRLTTKFFQNTKHAGKRLHLAGVDSIIHKKSENFSENELGTEEYQQIVEKMETCLDKFTVLSGMAAPQIGIPKRMIIIKRHYTPSGKSQLIDYLDSLVPEDEGNRETFILVNPDYKPLDEQFSHKVEEQCGSVPMFSAEIPRFKFIQLDAICGDSGEKISLELSDYDSMIMQHEIDHLEGITLLDRARESNQKINLDMAIVGKSRFGYIFNFAFLKYFFKMFLGGGYKKEFRS